MTEFDDGDSIERWEQVLAGEGLAPIEAGQDNLLPGQLNDAWQRAEQELGPDADPSAVIDATVSDLRERKVHVRDIGFNKWVEVTDFMQGVFSAAKQRKLELVGIPDEDDVEDRTIAQLPEEGDFAMPVNSLLPVEVQRLLAPLDERERQIMALRFGLDRGEPRTLEEVGEYFNLTRDRIRQIEARAMGKLRHPGTNTSSFLL